MIRYTVGATDLVHERMALRAWDLRAHLKREWGAELSWLYVEPPRAHPPRLRERLRGWLANRTDRPDENRPEDGRSPQSHTGPGTSTHA